MLDIIKAILLGIVEGVTEWLPISSTGHLIIAEEFIGFNSVTPQFREMFEVVIQLGAILAVAVLFWNKLWPIGIHNNRLHLKKNTLNLWVKVLIGCLPAAIIGIPLDDWMNEHFFNYIVVSIALIVYGVAFIFIENSHKNKLPRINNLRELDYKTAVLIGCFQVLSLIPGTSRSGSTILGAILLGCGRTAAAEYSFYMAIPVMCGASLLKGVKYLKFVNESGLGFSGYRFIILLTGMVIAFIVSIIAIKFLLSYIKKKDFKVFGWYRIALGALVLLYFLVIK